MVAAGTRLGPYEVLPLLRRSTLDSFDLTN